MASTSTVAIPKNITRYEDVKNPKTQQAETMGRQDFLKLFTTQLQNQNPLDPMKNEEFVAQLAQFSQLEATTNMSESLKTLVDSMKGDRMIAGASLIGRKVAAPDVPAVLTKGAPVQAMIDLPSGADAVKITVTDGLGRAVRTETLGKQGVGAMTYTWDGLDGNGKALADGNYKIAAAVTLAGQNSAATVSPIPTVRSVSTTGAANEPVIEVDGGRTVLLSTVTRIGN